LINDGTFDFSAEAGANVSFVDTFALDAVESLHKGIGDPGTRKADNAFEMVEDTIGCYDHGLKQVSFGFAIGLHPIAPFDELAPEAFQRVQVIDLLQIQTHLIGFGCARVP